MSKNKVTLSIGIPAHNEENSILRLLESINNQNLRGIELKSISVHCDGCTDSTAEIVRAYAEEYKGLNIKVVDDGKRLGQIGRINLICEKATTDVLVLFDADIKLGSENVLNELVGAFEKGENVGVVGGLEKPARARNLREKIFIVWWKIWYDIRKGLNGGDSIHNLAGCVIALKRDYYSTLRMPKEAIAQDEYIYFDSKKRGWNFIFNPKAYVYFKLPSTISDYVEQSLRWMKTKSKIHNFFDFNTDEYYSVSGEKKFEVLKTYFKKNLFLTILALAIQSYVRAVAWKRGNLDFNGGIWQPLRSTK